MALGSKGGDILALEGDLGSGKTTFIKGFAKALGIENEITSPTFVLLKKYRLRSPFKGIEFLVHVDCYRIDSAEDAESIGLFEYFGQKNCLLVLEWPNKVKNVLPGNIKQIKFEYINETTRKIIVEEKE